MTIDHRQAVEELGDFAHQREPYDTKWMDDRIGVFLERNLVIPRTELPPVGEDEWRGINAPKEYHEKIRAFDGQECSEKYWLIALLTIARAEHLEKEEAAISRQRENKALQQRRDELASEFTAVKSYGGQLPYTQKLIDHIIFLEGASK